MGTWGRDTGIWGRDTWMWGRDTSHRPHMKKGIGDPLAQLGTRLNTPKLGTREVQRGQERAGGGEGMHRGDTGVTGGVLGAGQRGLTPRLTPLRCRRNGKTSSGTGWRTCAPSRARRCTTSTSSRGSPSVSTARHGTATPHPSHLPTSQLCHIAPPEGPRGDKEGDKRGDKEGDTRCARRAVARVRHRAPIFLHHPKPTLPVIPTPNPAVPGLAGDTFWGPGVRGGGQQRPHASPPVPAAQSRSWRPAASSSRSSRCTSRGSSSGS